MERDVGPKSIEGRFCTQVPGMSKSDDTWEGHCSDAKLPNTVWLEFAEYVFGVKAENTVIERSRPTCTCFNSVAYSLKRRIGISGRAPET